MKLIDFETTRKIARGIQPIRFYEWVDDALRMKDSFQMPPKVPMRQKDGNNFGVMPCLWNDENLAMVKMIGRHTVRTGESRPAMMGDLLLYEADTGILKAVMDAEYITTIRTGAAAAHATVLYGKKGFKTIGLIGLGNIMAAYMEVLLEVMGEEQLTVKLYRHNGQEIRFYRKYKNCKNLSFRFCDDYDGVVRGSDIIVSAVTRVDSDFCPDDCYGQGCTVIPIMTLGFRNCDLSFDRVFADDVDQIRGFQNFNKFKSLRNTSDVLLGKATGRLDGKQRILVYNYGLALWDLYFAKKIYELADKDVPSIPYEYCKEKYFMG